MISGLAPPVGVNQHILQYTCIVECPIVPTSTTSKRFSNVTRGDHIGAKCIHELLENWLSFIHIGMISGVFVRHSIPRECFSTVTCTNCLMQMSRYQPGQPV